MLPKILASHIGGFLSAANVLEGILKLAQILSSKQINALWGTETNFISLLQSKKVEWNPFCIEALLFSIRTGPLWISKNQDSSSSTSSLSNLLNQHRIVFQNASVSYKCNESIQFTSMYQCFQHIEQSLLMIPTKKSPHKDDKFIHFSPDSIFMLSKLRPCGYIRLGPKNIVHLLFHQTQNSFQEDCTTLVIRVEQYSSFKICYLHVKTPKNYLSFEIIQNLLPHVKCSQIDVDLAECALQNIFPSNLESMCVSKMDKSQLQEHFFKQSQAFMMELTQEIGPHVNFDATQEPDSSMFLNLDEPLLKENYLSKSQKTVSKSEEPNLFQQDANDAGNVSSDSPEIIRATMSAYPLENDVEIIKSHIEPIEETFDIVVKSSPSKLTSTTDSIPPQADSDLKSSSNSPVLLSSILSNYKTPKTLKKSNETLTCSKKNNPTSNVLQTPNTILPKGLNLPNMQSQANITEKIKIKDLTNHTQNILKTLPIDTIWDMIHQRSSRNRQQAFKFAHTILSLSKKKLYALAKKQLPSHLESFQKIYKESSLAFKIGRMLFLSIPLPFHPFDPLFYPPSCQIFNLLENHSSIFKIITLLCEYFEKTNHENPSANFPEPYSKFHPGRDTRLYGYLFGCSHAVSLIDYIKNPLMLAWVNSIEKHSKILFHFGGLAIFNPLIQSLDSQLVLTCFYSVFSPVNPILRKPIPSFRHIGVKLFSEALDIEYNWQLDEIQSLLKYENFSASFHQEFQMYEASSLWVDPKKQNLYPSSLFHWPQQWFVNSPENQPLHSYLALHPCFNELNSSLKEISPEFANSRRKHESIIGNESAGLSCTSLPPNLSRDPLAAIDQVIFNHLVSCKTPKTLMFYINSGLNQVVYSFLNNGYQSFDSKINFSPFIHPASVFNWNSPNDPISHPFTIFDSILGDHENSEERINWLNAVSRGISELDCSILCCGSILCVRLQALLSKILINQVFQPNPDEIIQQQTFSNAEFLFKTQPKPPLTFKVDLSYRKKISHGRRYLNVNLNPFAYISVYTPFDFFSRDGYLWRLQYQFKSTKILKTLMTDLIFENKDDKSYLIWMNHLRKDLEWVTLPTPNHLFECFSFLDSPDQFDNIIDLKNYLNGLTFHQLVYIGAHYGIIPFQKMVRYFKTKTILVDYLCCLPFFPVIPRSFDKNASMNYPALISMNDYGFTEKLFPTLSLFERFVLYATIQNLGVLNDLAFINSPKLFFLQQILKGKSLTFLQACNHPTRKVDTNLFQKIAPKFRFLCPDKVMENPYQIYEKHIVCNEDNEKSKPIPTKNSKIKSKPTVENSHLIKSQQPILRPTSPKPPTLRKVRPRESIKSIKSIKTRKLKNAEENLELDTDEPNPKRRHSSSLETSIAQLNSNIMQLTNILSTSLRSQTPFTLAPPLTPSNLSARPSSEIPFHPKPSVIQSRLESTQPELFNSSFVSQQNPIENSSSVQLIHALREIGEMKTLLIDKLK